MAGETVEIVAQVMAGMRRYFVDCANAPLGGHTPSIQHRGGLLVPIDGFSDNPDSDDCSSQAFVNVLRRWRTTQFPAESGDVAPCGGSRAVLVQMGVARCSVALDHDGNPPSEERMEYEALVLLDDADRLDAAVCWANAQLDDAGIIDAAVINAWEPVGPEGGILTGLLTVSYQIA